MLIELPMQCSPFANLTAEIVRLDAAGGQSERMESEAWGARILAVLVSLGISATAITGYRLSRSERKFGVTITTGLGRRSTEVRA